MERSMKHLPDAELEIMQIIWAAGGPVTSADIISRITPPGRWANTTVLNFLGRLVEKGFLHTRKQGKCNVYTADVEEQAYLNQESGVLFERLYGRSLTGMLDALYQGGSIDDDDLRELYHDLGKRLQVEQEPDAKGGRGEGRWKSWYKRYFPMR